MPVAGARRMTGLSERNCILLHRLQRLGAPKCFVRLVFRVVTLPLCTEQTLDFVEYYAGEQQCTEAYKRAGFSAKSFEYLRDKARLKKSFSAVQRTSNLHCGASVHFGNSKECARWGFESGRAEHAQQPRLRACDSHGVPGEGLRAGFMPDVLCAQLCIFARGHGMLVRERALCCLVDKLQLLLEGRGRRNAHVRVWRSRANANARVSGLRRTGALRCWLLFVRRGCLSTRASPKGEQRGLWGTLRCRASTARTSWSRGPCCCS